MVVLLFCVKTEASLQNKKPKANMMSNKSALLEQYHSGLQFVSAECSFLTRKQTFAIHGLSSVHESSGKTSGHGNTPFPGQETQGTHVTCKNIFGPNIIKAGVDDKRLGNMALV